MYILPGYTDFYEANSVIYVTSKLHQNEIKLTDPKIQEEFRSIVKCGGCQNLSTPLTQFLHEQELLSTEAEIKCALKNAKQLLNDSLLLTIMPTEGCNFRCPYCYEDHSPVSMSRKMLDQILAFITQQAPLFKNVHISWFGGEPTLCKDTVLEVSSLVQSLQAKHSFNYVGGMTTNGYLLGINYFQQFYAAGITSYQITLDGWNHDQTRPHVSGKGTLQTILKNLTALAALPREQYHFQIILRHNILAGDRDFSWYDYLYKLFGKDDRFSVLVYPVGNWGGESVKELNLINGTELNSLPLEHVSYLNKIGMKTENRGNHPFSKICYASYPHSMVFRANGKIEKCTLCLDHPKNLLGYLDQEKGVILDQEVNKLWSTADLKSECYHCSDVLSCFNLRCKKAILVDGQECACCSGSF